MLRKIGRLFVIKTRFEAYAVIFALALGAVERGKAYLDLYPGNGGKLLFLAATGDDCHVLELKQSDRSALRKITFRVRSADDLAALLVGPPAAAAQDPALIEALAPILKPSLSSARGSPQGKV